MVGRVLTIQFMPSRGDIAEVDEAEAKAKGKSPRVTRPRSTCWGPET